jgi:hypothetical protein
MHETYKERGPTKTSSDRGFGIVFTVVFALIAGFQLYAGRIEWAMGLGAVAAVFLAVALVRPTLLAPLNRLWTRFGLLLHRIVNPLVMGVMFFGVITPFGLAMRLFGWDALSRKRKPEAASYWIEREPGPAPETMRHQF